MTRQRDLDPIATHEARLPLPAPKMYDMMYRATCSCGWVGVRIGSAKDARKATKDHVKRMLANELQERIAEAEAQCHSPEEVMDAARALWRDQHDFAGVAWEKGTTVIVVFSWDSTVAIRYVLNADLTDVIHSERVSARGR